MQSTLGAWIKSPKVRSEPFVDSESPRKKNIPCPWNGCHQRFMSEKHLEQHALAMKGPHLEEWAKANARVCRFWESAEKQMVAMVQTSSLINSAMSLRPVKGQDHNEQKDAEKEEEGEVEDADEEKEEGEKVEEENSSADSRDLQSSSANVMEPPLKRSKPKQLRHRFKVRQKFQTLREFDRLVAELSRVSDAAGVDSIPSGIKKKVIDIISKQTGIAASTITDWTHVSNRAKIEEEVKRLLHQRKAKEMKVIPSAKLVRPWFPLTEEKLYDEIVDARKKHLRFSRMKAVKRYRDLAQEENAEKFAKARIGDGLLFRFFKRRNLALRIPGCVKAKSLEVSIKEVRGFLVWFRENLLRDKNKHAKNPLDPKFGRFPLRCRLNKDEVPLRFGDSRKTITGLGERNVHVSQPEGWADRVGTMVLGASADGHLLDVVLIFKGKHDATIGATKAERAEYENNPIYKGVHVIFQKKAWIDSVCEDVVIKKQVIPYVKGLSCESGTKCEVLLQQDNVSAHFNESSLRLCSENGILALGSPPGLTNYIQLIDLNVGKCFRNDIYSSLDEEVEQSQTKSFKAVEKRKLLAKLVAKTVRLWREDEHKKNIIRTAANRTGLSIPAYGDFPDLRPQNFPEDFHSSVCDEKHPLHDVVIPFTFSRRKESEECPEGAGMAPDMEEAEEMDDGWSSEEEDHVYTAEEIFQSTAAHNDRLEEYLMEAEDEGLIIKKRNRGCLGDCGCLANRPKRCGCSSHGGCMERCSCKGLCSVGLAACSNQSSNDLIHIDTALRVEDGEHVLDAILGRETNGNFIARWQGGEVTYQPIQDFVDDDDGCFYNPLILPYLSERERKFLDEGDVKALLHGDGEIQGLVDDAAFQDTEKKKNGSAPKPVQTSQGTSYVINIFGGTNSVHQGPSRNE